MKKTKTKDYKWSIKTKELPNKDREVICVLEDEEIKEIKDDNNEQTINIIKRKEVQQDALSALQNLGFKTAEAQSTIDKILIENDFIDASQLVKKALRSLAKG